MDGNDPNVNSGPAPSGRTATSPTIAELNSVTGAAGSVPIDNNAEKSKPEGVDTSKGDAALPSDRMEGKTQPGMVGPTFHGNQMAKSPAAAPATNAAPSSSKAEHVEPLQSTPNGTGTTPEQQERQGHTPEPQGTAPRVRAMKSKEQKEALEAAYSLKQYPEEDVRRALGERIGLTEQQVQMWFSHKRRKVKKDQEEAALRETVEKRLAEEREQQQPGRMPDAAQLAETQQNGALQASEHGQQPGVAAKAEGNIHDRPAEKQPTDGGNASAGPAQARQSPQAASSDPLNKPQPKATNAQATVPVQPARASGEPSSVPLDAAPGQPDQGPEKESAIARLVKLLKAQPPARELTVSERLQIPELLEAAKQGMKVPFREDGPPLAFEFDETPLIDDSGAYLDEQPPSKRKRVDGDAEEAPRKRRQSAGAKGSARNKAERMEKEEKKQLMKAERESKRKEVAREKEETRLRALQEREEKKLQAQAEKERRAQERKEAISERKKEKEVLKALQAQEKQATRLRQRDAGTGPPDDLDLEWEALISQQQADGYGSGTEEGGPRDHTPPTRPEFPPPHLQFKTWLPPELEGSTGADLLFAWSFLRSFRGLLHVPAITVHQLLQALMDGEKSRLLGELHIAMMRILQADMEEAHATGAMQSGAAINFLDKAIVSCATRLEEAWAWGFDVDAWRAHLGPQTWPEVLRQLAIVWGKGPIRPKPRKVVRPKMGTDGEDIYPDETGQLKLRLPSRYGMGTVKAAAWAVLAETGPQGLSIGEIARRIQQSGLRDLRTSKTPEASVAGALSRDVIFARVAPATYALQSLVTYHSQLSGEAGPATDKPMPGRADAAAASLEKPSEQAAAKEESPDDESRKADEKAEEDDHEADSSGDEEEEDESALGQATGEQWVQTLLTTDYKDIELLERATILAALAHLTLDGPTMRNTMEARQEEAGRIRKKMWEEARAEKRRRQEEAAQKAKQAAEEAAVEAEKVLEALKGREGSVAGSDRPTPAPPESGTATPAPEQGGHSISPTPNPSPERVPQPSGDKATSKERQPSEPQADKAASTEPPGSSKPASVKAEEGTAEVREADADRSTPAETGPEPKKDPAEEDKEAQAAAAKERQLQRAEAIRKVEEANATRLEPLGLDRRHNRYWRFADADDCAEDPLASCLIAESHEDGSFRYLGHEDGVEALIQALDKRGAREGPLYNNLLRYREALAKPGFPFRMVDPHDEEASQQLWEDQEAWVKESKLVAARKAKGRHPNPQDDDPCIARLRQDFLLVEKALPAHAFADGWDSRSWKESILACSTAPQFRDCLAQLESSLSEPFLSPFYLRLPLLVQGAWLPTGQEVASALLGTNGEIQKLPKAPNEASPVSEPEAGLKPLCWLPQTLASVALRLHSLDANLMYSGTGQAEREVLMAYNYTQRPTAPPRAANSAAQQLGSYRPRLLNGLPIVSGGRALPILLPPFPVALAAAERQAFTLEWSHLKKEIADERAGILPPPKVPKLVITLNRDQPGKKGKKGSAKGKATGKGKSGKGKVKSRQSALREEFDRQSEEEEAAERAAFSTPGFSDDDSDDFQPRGRKRKMEAFDDEEISD